MKRNFKQVIKRALVKTGAYVPAEAIRQIDAAISYSVVGRWQQQRCTKAHPCLPDREAIWQHISRDLRDRRVLYVELGVWKGEATRYWADLLKHPDSQLHGFDSFEGLPETWNWAFPKGMFDVGGIIPRVDDRRVQFHKGWIEDTLPTWTPAGDFDRVVINFDLDLYSSTRTALTHLEALIVPGTLLYFDEFADRNNELKAFEEYLQRTGQVFEAVASNPTFAHVVFGRTL